ncbi:MAG: hypothetical protein ABWZ40_10470 [Caulobacterales bacterium]
MPIIRIFTPENRLARILKDAGGLTVDELVAAAETRVSALQSRLAAAVDEDLAKILAIGRQHEAAIFADGKALGDAALAVAELAGAIDCPEIGEIARGIRIMVEGLVDHGVWHSGALGAHLEALALLSQHEGEENVDFTPLLLNLRAVRLKIGLAD